MKTLKLSNIVWCAALTLCACGDSSVDSTGIVAPNAAESDSAGETTVVSNPESSSDNQGSTTENQSSVSTEQSSTTEEVVIEQEKKVFENFIILKKFSIFAASF